MNKQDLADEILAANYTTTKKSAGEIVDLIFGKIAAAMVEGQEVSLPGLGKFKTVTRAARTCLNIQTGEKIESQAHSVVKFVPCKALKDAVR